MTARTDGETPRKERPADLLRRHIKSELDFYVRDYINDRDVEILSRNLYDIAQGHADYKYSRRKASHES